MKVVFQYPLQTSPHFPIAVPVGAKFLQVAQPVSPFDEGCLLVLVDPEEKRGELMHFHWVSGFEAFDDSDLEFVGAKGRSTLWLSKARTPVPMKEG